MTTSSRILFRPPVKPWGTPGHVVLNWNRDPLTDLDHIAESYRSVAHDRVELLRQQRPPLHAGDEFEAYPIVFLYRHALELRLKAIILAGSVLLKEEGHEPMALSRLKKHELLPLVKECARIFKLLNPTGNPWDFGLPGLRNAGDFEAVIREFDEVDAGSFAFRYSVGTDFASASLGNNFAFNLFAFADLMDKIVRDLAGAPEVLREVMQDRWEAAYETQQEAWENSEMPDPSDLYPE